MNNQAYKYRRADFVPLPIRLDHLTIYLNFVSSQVEVENVLQMTAKEAITEVALDAKELDIVSVDFMGREITSLDYDHNQLGNKLRVKLPGTVPAGNSFAIRTRTTCIPSDNVLEGIYKDTTPDGCPQQYVSQCQQWGFQRIMPIFDDCTAKCTMTTTIEADARYRQLITNGNIDAAANPDGKPVPKPGDPSRQIITYDNPVPMAPYLFVVCAGTWDVLEDEITYPSGRTVKLEYLVPPGRAADAVIPMEILKESVLWQNRTQNYEYRGEVYRTICMEKSNFGGMENTGNTTIVTGAALLDQYTNDMRLHYAHGVIVHEFEHNQCGSDVTMETPFDMWLNEAFTVDVERQFSSSLFDPVSERLNAVDVIRNPVSGPLAIEDAGHMGNIVREAFNDPDELIDSLTYVKASEVIRMLRILLGESVFVRSKDLYFSRYNGGNATTDDFFTCFEEESGRDLTQFKRQWLYTIGYPHVEASHVYDADRASLEISITQKRSGPGELFHLPLELAAVSEEGRDIEGTARTIELSDATQTLTIPEVKEAPAFISYNRQCSFYGTFTDRSSSVDHLVKQAQIDPDLFNRVEAMRRLTDIERIKLVKNSEAAVDDRWLNLFATALGDPSLPAGVKSYLLRIDEQPLDRKFFTRFRELYAARERLLKAVSTYSLSELLRQFHAIDTYRPAESPRDGMEERKLKGVLLRLIISADTPDTHKLAEDHFRAAWNVSDKLSALSAINLSSHPGRRDLLEEGYELWQDHLNAYAGYLIILGSGTHGDIFDMIATEEKRPAFRIEHPSCARSLYIPLTGNNKMLWTNEGLQWAAATAMKLAPVSEFTAVRFVACFRHVQKLADDLKPKVISTLNDILGGIDADAVPALAGRVRSYLGEQS